MATANTNLRITELDFDSIKTNIKNYLKAQSEFTDYDFEGSGLSVLLDVLAYNTHYMGMYVNMIGNEMFLDTAQLRSSILSLAKLTNYVPTSRKGAYAKVNITVTPGPAEDDTVATLILPQYTRFLSSQIDGVSYNFLNTQSVQAEKNISGVFNYYDIPIIQGELATQSYTVTSENDKRRFTIPSANIDTNTLVVTVQESEYDNTTSVYTLAGDINEITANSKVYYLEESSDANGNYTIYFGDNHLGKRPVNDNIVILKYLDTQGSVANEARDFTAIDGVGAYTANVIVTTVSDASGGAEKETIEEVRFRAPISYVTQNRAVTKNDYGVLLLKDYPYIESVAVWGGEENDPVMYGKVFISLKPKENYEVSLAEKERIKDEIIANRSILSVFPEFIDPDYTYLKVKAVINYNPRLTDKTEGQLVSAARNAILNYRNLYLKQFNSTFRKSVLQRMLDTADPSFISSSLDVILQKRFEPIIGATKNYQFDYLTQLSKGNFDNKLFAFPTFSITDGINVDRETYLEETPNAFTGLDSITVINPGSNYVTAPTVTITGDGSGATAQAKITNGKVTSISIVTRGSNYTTATVSLSGGDGFGASAKANLGFNSGTLRTYYVKSNGEKVFLNENAGTINYLTGRIILTNFVPKGLTLNSYYEPSVLTLCVPADDSVIPPLRNRILDIDEYDASSIQVVMVPEA